MRRWDGRKYFSFFEDMTPEKLNEILDKSRPVFADLERMRDTIRWIPYYGVLIERRIENEEIYYNSIIGIA